MDVDRMDEDFIAVSAEEMLRLLGSLTDALHTTADEAWTFVVAGIALDEAFACRELPRDC
jgi:hypothetical protein